MIRLTKEEARNFLLAKQGLLGHKQFSGKEGLMDFVRQAGSVQFDPVDVCGTSPELTLQARIEYFTKEMLDAYIELKTEDVRRLNTTTHPVEFDMYYSL